MNFLKSGYLDDNTGIYIVKM